ncbi:MAG: hypothetical protein QF674_00630 [Candidatus Marinimicrobia bacterium]|nr:hypothetical protein [Candidatus Neomarinimicrobiota bacterium]
MNSPLTSRNSSANFTLVQSYTSEYENIIPYGRNGKIKGKILLSNSVNLQRLKADI